MSKTFKTADLYDDYADELSIATPGFKSFGQHSSFYGPIATVKVHEDNVLVKDTLATSGKERVLVVDGGGSLRCALVGDILAQMAIDNGWAGLIVFGCIRDSAEIDQMNIGIRALDTHPAKSTKRGAGIIGDPLQFCGVSFFPGDHVYSDQDGIIVCRRDILS